MSKTKTVEWEDYEPDWEALLGVKRQEKTNPGSRFQAQGRC
ncbi:Uncharacterised protein [Candidatus Gugararchaeum adminiculabundum]|nr:Uncharacterised protein [Candidatus Gugararchaeum adminiculabundum]